MDFRVMTTRQLGLKRYREKLERCHPTNTPQLQRSTSGNLRFDLVRTSSGWHASTNTTCMAHTCTAARYSFSTGNHSAPSSSMFGDVHKSTIQCSHTVHQ